MDYEQVKYELENSASVTLLRKNNAAFILSFLYKQFKEKQQISISASQLEIKLEDYKEYCQEIERERYPRSAKEYLNEWCNDKLLKQKYEKDEPIYTLTSETEQAIRWVQELTQREEFIGTESRFLQIFDLLKEIRYNSTTDVETRIQQLEKERDIIQQQIDEIREKGVVERFNKTRLQERFILANQLSRQLIADFKEIEQNFHNLARKLQEIQLQKNLQKGSLVGGVLDADEQLTNSDQGRSFDTFWRFLMSGSKQEELDDLIKNAYALEDLQPLTSEAKELQRIKHNLIKAAEHIIQSNSKLVQKLRQALDERNLRENPRVAELIVEVQRLALQIVDKNLADEEFLELEGEPDVNLVMDRPLHLLEESENPTFTMDFSEVEEFILDEEIAEIYEQFYVDEKKLELQIEEALEYQATITLTELIEMYPVAQGLPEIVAYLGIAGQSDKHRINNDKIEPIMIQSLEPEKYLRLCLPQVIFCR